MVERKEYLQKLWSWKDEQVIKVVTGIRRCGKSTLLKCLFGIYSKDSGTITLEGKEVNFKNSKGKKYFAGFIAIILVAAMVLSLCITIFS